MANSPFLVAIFFSSSPLYTPPRWWWYWSHDSLRKWIQCYTVLRCVNDKPAWKNTTRSRKDACLTWPWGCMHDLYMCYPLPSDPGKLPLTGPMVWGQRGHFRESSGSLLTHFLHMPWNVPSHDFLVWLFISLRCCSSPHWVACRYPCFFVWENVMYTQLPPCKTSRLYKQCGEILINTKHMNVEEHIMLWLCIVLRKCLIYSYI